MIMNERSLRVLEYPKILNMLQEHCVSDMGRTRAAALTPSSHRAEVIQMQQETEEACSVLIRLGGTPVIWFQDVSQPLHLSTIGGTLSPRMLLQIAELLRASRAVKEPLTYDVEKGQETPILYGMAMQINTLHSLEDAISEAILSEDEISDHASSELASIRRKMRNCNERVREKLNSMIRSSSFQKYLQDPIITVRQDRFVLPVKQEYRGMVPGIVHDQSTSGATIFIEPTSVVEIGNEIKQLVAEEKAEIERILQSLSAQVQPHASEIATNLEILTSLDFIFAKAALSRSMYGTAPKINDQLVIDIKEARHPLIDPDVVVPLTIQVGERFTTLVITGPNTGGKTVTLKTVGLFCAMAQSGLHVPAAYGSSLPVFDEIYADIGDEQSIEQSLSTFSGHMTNIVSILQTVTPDSLVLFDELGAGTDPTEGAALAQAILTDLLKMNVRTVATTHYSELKEFAMTTSGVENACVEFDVTTLRPTYHLLIGIPGKSNAFEISKKLGLPDSIIETAKGMLSNAQIQFEDVLADAEYHRQIAKREREIAEETSKEIAQLKKQADEEKRKLIEQHDRAVKKAKDEAKRIVENAKRESENLIAELRSMRKNGIVQEHELQGMRQRMDELQDRNTEKPVVAQQEALQTVHSGDRVHIVSMDMDGNVAGEPDAKGNVTVKAGRLNIRVHITDLTSSKPEKIKEKKKKDIYQPQNSSSLQPRIDIATRTVRRELDIRGMAVDEALPEVSKFIDDATLSSLGEVCIIHGVGSGILRTGVQNALRRNPMVKSFRLGQYGEGESGVTIVTLK